MRIRIVRSCKGVVDGVRADRYHEGLTYDLPPTLASLLVVEGWAEPLGEPAAPESEPRVPATAFQASYVK